MSHRDQPIRPRPYEHSSQSSRAGRSVKSANQDELYPAEADAPAVEEPVEEPRSVEEKDEELAPEAEE